MKHKIILIMGILIALILFISLKPVFTGSDKKLPQSNVQVPVINNSVLLGSTQYNWYIKSFAIRYGNKAALLRIMDDVDKYGSQIDKNTTDNNLRLYKLVSDYINKIGYVDMQTHYFRNKLNRAPETLEKLLLQNEKLPAERRWKLVSLQGSLFHMQGRDGIFNLKFISPDKFCEAVYNRNGELLTERNDPVNMGTFNYAPGIHQKNAHEKYDVTPYLKWGNDPGSPQKGQNAIRRGINAAALLYNQSSSDVEAYRLKATTVKPGMGKSNKSQS